VIFRFLKTRLSWIGLLLLVLVGSISLGGCGGGGSGGNGEGDLETLLSNLENAGFRITEGDPVQIDLEDLFCRGLLPSGYGNNVTTPYITLRQDPVPGAAPTAFPWTYRLRQDEAMVLLGRTAPKSVYFSLQTFAALRWFEDKGYTGRMFALFGDTINHLTINAQGEDTPYDSFFVMITTGNKRTEEKVRDALSDAGYGNGTVNVETIPGELVRFGLDESGDQFSFLYRIALVENPEEERRYYETVGGMRLFRLTPEEELSPAPYPVKTLRPRGTGSNELHLLPSLKKLEDALLETYSGFQAEKLPTAPYVAEGYNPILQDIDALGATNDTTYLLTPPFSLEEDDFVIAYGVQHAAAGKALYNSVIAYGWTLLEDLPDDPRFEGLREMMGIAAIDSPEDFAGSARPFLPGDPQADLLYVVKIARSSGGQQADLLIPPPSCRRLKLRELALAFRAYCEPATKTGPAYAELLFDRAILFRRR
jgi:hypothetical protein